MRRHVVALGRGRELQHDAPVEHLPFDGPAADDVALLSAQPVEASLEQRLDRRRHDDLRRRPPRTPWRASPRGTAGSRRRPARMRRACRRSRWPCRELVDEPLAVVARQRLEQDRRGVQLAPAPAGTELEQLGARDAEQEDRGIARPVGDVLDQVEEDRLRPLDVVEEDELRPLRGASLQQPAECELRLGGRRADHVSGLDADRDQDLDQWPVRDVLAVVEAATRSTSAGLPDAVEELLRPGATCRRPPARAA